MKINIELIERNNKKPQIIKNMTSGSAGFDIAAFIDKDIILEPNSSALIPTGIKAEIPSGYVGLLFIRSSLGIKSNITLQNSVGVIDSDFRGEIKIGLFNNSKEDFTIQNNMRIAQLCIVPYETPEIVIADSLSDTDRGEGGFGSTGK